MSGIFIFSLLPSVFIVLSILARFFLLKTGFFLSKAFVYKFFFLPISFTKSKITFAFAIEKLFVFYKMLYGIV